MKRFSFLLMSLVIVFSCMFSGAAFAEENQANLDEIPDSIRDSSVYQEDPLSSLDTQETNQLKGLHQEIINKGLISLNEAGQMVLNNGTFDIIKVDSVLQKNYIENIERINFLLEQGGVSLDQDFNLQMASSEEISNSISQHDLETKQNQEIIAFGDPGAPPALYAYSTALQNYNEMYEIWASLALGIYGNPVAALSYTTSWFVTKVKPGGAWDYKVVPGYSPYNKEWTAYVKGGVAQIRTSEWFGNYNFGFTGKLLFPLNILYTGGDIVSQITGGAPDNFEDKANIAQGYNENTL